MRPYEVGTANFATPPTQLPVMLIVSDIAILIHPNPMVGVHKKQRTWHHNMAARFATTVMNAASAVNHASVGVKKFVLVEAFLILVHGAVAHTHA